MFAMSRRGYLSASRGIQHRRPRFRPALAAAFSRRLAPVQRVGLRWSRGAVHLENRFVGLDAMGIGSIADLLKTGVEKIWPDPEKAAAAKTAILQAQNAGLFKQMDADLQTSLAQIAANAAEAAQPGLHFRDGAGWVCVAAFGVMTLKPLLEWGCALSGHPISLPPVDTSVSMTMLSGLLGLGGLHAYQQVSAAK